MEPTIITNGEVCPTLQDMMTVPNASWFPDNGIPRHLIVVSLPDIAGWEVDELDGPLRFDLCVYHELLMLLMETDSSKFLYVMPWASLATADHIEPAANEDPNTVWLVVMDHITGVVMSQSQWHWPEHFQRQIENQFSRLQRVPITFTQAEGRVAQMWRDYPDGYQLRERSIAHCLVGS